MMIEQLQDGEYRRVSTHVADEPIEHHSIDVPVQYRDKEGYILPNNKYTLLFFVRDQGYMIIKPESEGAHDIHDRVGHALGLAGSVTAV